MLRIFKYFASILSIVFIIALIGIYVWNSDSEVKTEAAALKSNRSVYVSEQYRMSFTFDGDQTEIIDLIKGKAEFKLVYTGSSKFTARLLNKDGTLVTMLADVNGPYNQKQEIDVPETHSYLLDVKTLGEWSLARD